MIFNLRASAEHHISGLNDLMMKAARVADNIRLGGHRKSKAGTGEQFWQFRPYNPTSDAPQDIDWRQSAKSSGQHGDIAVREKELQIPQDNRFWVDLNKGMEFRSHSALPSKAETAQIMTLALALLLTKSGEDMGLCGGKKGRSEKALESFAAHLVEGARTHLTPPFQTSAKSNLFMIGDFLSPVDKLESHIAPLAARASRGVLIQILDPAELDLSPYDGRAVFSDPDTNNETPIENVSDIKSAYTHRIAAHIDALKTLCNKQGWIYVLHVTNTDIKDTILTLQQEAQDR